MFEEYDDVLSVDEACKALKTSNYNLLNSGSLNVFRNGRIGTVKSYAQISLQTPAK